MSETEEMSLGRGGLQNLLRHLRQMRNRGVAAGRSFDPMDVENDRNSGFIFKVLNFRIGPKVSWSST